MVRTSDFQFENVGSIPSDPILEKNKNIIFFLSNNKNYQPQNNLNMGFTFISTISPFLINNLRLDPNLNSLDKKILIKQSYILLTWFYYISFLQQKINNKNKLNFFIFPLNNKKFTLTKAPIAHKNWSKEQYKYSYYKFNIKFNSILKEENFINNVNTALLFFILSKKEFPFFETNLLFLKKTKIDLFYNDFNFFNFFKFIYNI